jgi:hypothetical protein
MQKKSLTDWAAIAEIIAAVAVVVSLLFVAHTVSQNTKAVQVQNDNFLYELQFARAREISANPDLAAIYVKVSKGESLTEVETTRFIWDKYQELSAWELAFNRHRDGLYSDENWEAWDNYYQEHFLEQFLREWWEEARIFYMPEFQQHVDDAYARK